MAVEPRNRFSKHDQMREKVEKCAAEPPLDRRATFLRQRGAAQLTSFLSVSISLIACSFVTSRREGKKCAKSALSHEISGFYNFLGSFGGNATYICICFTGIFLRESSLASLILGLS